MCNHEQLPLLIGTFSARQDDDPLLREMVVFSHGTEPGSIKVTVPQSDTLRTMEIPRHQVPDVIAGLLRLVFEERS